MVKEGAKSKTFMEGNSLPEKWTGMQFEKAVLQHSTPGSNFSSVGMSSALNTIPG